MDLIEATLKALDGDDGEIITATEVIQKVLAPLLDGASDDVIRSAIAVGKKNGLFEGDSELQLAIASILTAVSAKRDIKIDEILTDDVANVTAGVAMAPVRMTDKPLKRKAIEVSGDIFENVDLLPYSTECAGVIQELNEHAIATISFGNRTKQIRRK